MSDRLSGREILEELRKDIKLPQAVFARSLGITRQAYGNRVKRDRGRDIPAEELSSMLSLLGYALCVMKDEDVPVSAIRVKRVLDAPLFENVACTGSASVAFDEMLKSSGMSYEELSEYVDMGSASNIYKIFHKDKVCADDLIEAADAMGFSLVLRNDIGEEIVID